MKRAISILKDAIEFREKVLYVEGKSTDDSSIFVTVGMEIALALLEQENNGDHDHEWI